ncbi:MAG: hypothetical protein BWY15_01512 [Firmicutes bacterium ADurb.Bin193]|nr:MAG: hypothetical protein BWY15_01512 [Firmicutes bacterium ADurb.Bin193]
MAHLETEEIVHSRWGRCVRLSNGAVDLLATLDFGPRIIRFGAVGGVNEFYEDERDFSNEKQESRFDVFGNKGNFHIYGGHRLWTGPEIIPRTIYPDNEPVMYTVIENGIRLTPPPQVWNGVQMEIDLVMDDDNRVEVTHKITNLNPWEIEFAPWALTAMQSGGLEVIPQNNSDTGLLHNRVITLWPYTDINDSRVNWGDDFITLRPTSSSDSAFKIGTNNVHGFAAYFNHGNLFVKKYQPVDGGVYPDGGVSYETYTKKNMVELETLGELKRYQPGETAVHTETWQLFLNVSEPESREEIREAMEEYMSKTV